MNSILEKLAVQIDGISEKLERELKCKNENFLLRLELEKVKGQRWMIVFFSVFGTVFVILIAGFFIE